MHIYREQLQALQLALPSATVLCHSTSVTEQLPLPRIECMLVNGRDWILATAGMRGPEPDVYDLRVHRRGCTSAASSRPRRALRDRLRALARDLPVDFVVVGGYCR